MLAVSAALEAEAEELLEPRKQRLHHCTPAWATEGDSISKNKMGMRICLKELHFSLEQCILAPFTTQKPKSQDLLCNFNYGNIPKYVTPYSFTVEDDCMRGKMTVAL